MVDWKKNMETEFPETMAFFSNVDIKGTFDERAKTVIDFIERANTHEKHFCIALKPNAETYFDIYLIEQSFFSSKKNIKMAEFENNGTLFIIGTLAKNQKIDDFQKRAIEAIDLAESKGGTLKEKGKQFRETLSEANLVLITGKEIQSGFYVCHTLNNYHSEMRGDTKYIVWF